MPRRSVKTADEIIVEIYMVAARLPNVDYFGKWIAEMQGLYSLYLRAVRREKRRKV